MEFANMVELFSIYGMSIVIIAYFLYKDYKFNDQLLQVLGEVKEVLAELRRKVLKRIQLYRELLLPLMVV